MIDKVRVLNDFGVDAVFIFSAVSDGITIKNVDGLGPVKASLNTTARVNGYGVTYNSKTIGSRNIVITMGLSRSGLKSVENVRQDVYRYFPVGEEVQLHISSGDKTCQIFGVVESTEPVIFAKEPSIQISVVCMEAPFIDYPGNQSIVLPTTGLGSIAYSGRVKTGLRVVFTVLRPTTPINLMGQVQLYQEPHVVGETAPYFQIHDFDLEGITGSRLKPGDVMEIVTHPGKKSATLTRATGVKYNIMGAVKTTGGYYLKETQWPVLNVAKTTEFKYESNSYTKEELKVELFWDTLVDGL